MGTVATFVQLLAVGLSMIDKHIEDPTRRLKARLEYKKEFQTKALDIIQKEHSVEEADKMSLDLLAAIDAM
jgi:hypothetical protein